MVVEDLGPGRRREYVSSEKRSLVESAELLEVAGRIEEAATVLKKVIEIDPEQSYRIYEKFLTLRLGQNLLKEGIIECSGLISRVPERRFGYALLAKALQNLGYQDQSAAFFQQGIGANEEALNRVYSRLCADADKGTVKESIDRILFVVSHLPDDPNSSHLQEMLDCAVVLTRHFGDLRIGILLTNEGSGVDSYPIQVNRLVVENAHEVILRERLETIGFDIGDHMERIRFIYGDPNSRDYLGELTDAIQDFKPDAVMCFGGILAARILAKPLYAAYPALHVPFNHTNNPCEDFDIYLSTGTPGRTTGRRHPTRWREYTLPLLPAAKRKTFADHQIEPPQGSEVLITVTANMNKRFVDNEFILNVVRFMERHPRTIWVLVGVDNREEFASRDPGLAALIRAGRVRFIRYERDLGSLYEQCDIFINHPYAGGGYSMALAMSEGLPVLTFEHNDACNFLTPLEIFRSYESYFAYLEELIENPELRARVGNKMRRLIAARSQRMVAEQLMGYIGEARRSYRARVSRDK